MNQCILGETALSQTLLRIVDYKEHLVCLDRNFLIQHVRDLNRLFRITETTVIGWLQFMMPSCNRTT